MRGKDLLEDMQYISDELVEEAMADMVIKYDNNGKWKKWGAAAACAAIVCISVISFQMQSKHRFEEISDIPDTDLEHASAADVTASLSPEKAAQESVHADLFDKAESLLEETGAGSISDRFSEKKSNDQDGFESEWSKENADESAEDKVSSYTIIDSFPPKTPKENDSKESVESLYHEDLESSLAYEYPQMGEYFYHQKLKEALEYYDGTNNTKDIMDTSQYAYQVVIEIFGNRVSEDVIFYEELCRSDSGKALLEKEHQRLVDIGYQISLSEEYQLTGIFTKEELENFEPSSNYGYAFRFEDEE